MGEDGGRETVPQDHGPAGTRDTGDTAVPAGEQGQVQGGGRDQYNNDGTAKDADKGEIREVDQDSAVGGGDTDVRSDEPDSGRPGRTDTTGIPVRSGLTVEKPTEIDVGGEKGKERRANGGGDPFGDLPDGHGCLMAFCKVGLWAGVIPNPRTGKDIIPLKLDSNLSIKFS